MGGHSKWNQNQEGYTYTKEEIEAYQVPYKIAKGPCVDTYIPMKRCSHDNPVSLAAQMLDQRRGLCSKEFSVYDNCLKHWMTYENNSHVTNAYFTNGSKATEAGLSGTYATHHRKGLGWAN